MPLVSWKDGASKAQRHEVANRKKQIANMHLKKHWPTKKHHEKNLLRADNNSNYCNGVCYTGN